METSNLKDVKRMHTLIKILNNASIMYHKYDDSVLTDKQYDDYYAELLDLENKMNIIMSNSPTKNIEGGILESLPVVKHVKPMLSCDKTKDVSIIKNFATKKMSYASWKLDGLTLVLTYRDGKLFQALTRGNGEYGEDVTAQASFIKNLPTTIPRKGELVVRGECVISWENFNKINENMDVDKKYSHPRNLAAGTIRQLNTALVKERNLDFILFECVTDLGNDFKETNFRLLESFGFTVVERCLLGVEDSIKLFNPEEYKYPVDGIVFEYNSIPYSISLGKTSKYENCRMALKWKDEVYETKLVGIEWNTSRTGLINPVAIFEEVDLDGAMTTRASVHNVSIVKRLRLGIGDTISVYRANKVIPQIYENLTKSNNCEIPEVCPICGAKANIVENDGVETLHCTNTSGCKAKLINTLIHFTEKDSMDIDGLGESTIERFVDLGILHKIEDIYDDEMWAKNKALIVNLQGFGELSYSNLMSAIKVSRNTTLTKFLTSLGIPYTGRGTCKKISDYCSGDISKFIEYYYSFFKWCTIKDVGAITECAISDYLDLNISLVENLSKELSFEVEKEEEVISNVLSGKVFAVTGELNKIRRANLVKLIQEMGGKFVKSVSKPKVGELYLINNDVTSKSTKNEEAKKLGIKIINEDVFFSMISKSNE